jgi:replicative DNA helicase
VLKDKYERRKIIQTCLEQIEDAFDNTETPSTEIAEKIITTLSDLNTYEKIPEKIGRIIPIILETFEKITGSGTGLGLKTGVKDIDSMIGGFLNGEMTLVAGRPSMGKTALALQIATHNAAQNIPTLIFSIETSNEQVCGRILCAQAGVSFDDILRGKTISREKWTELSIQAAKLSEYPIFIDETPAISIGQLIGKTENYAKNKNVKLIISDHIGLISNTSRARSRNEELSQISKKIKALGKNLKIPTITLSQLSREVEKRQPPIPRLSDLYESGSLEQDSDKVMFLYRDEYYNRKSEKKNIAEIILAKNKNGKTGFKEVYFDKPTMTFKNLSEINDPMNPALSPLPYKED